MIFVIFSILLDDLSGQIFSILILNVAAAESALGLAILIIYFRLKGTIALSQLNLLKG
jgi:NADH-quinone oxidoreductase subunit K